MNRLNKCMFHLIMKTDLDYKDLPMYKIFTLAKILYYYMQCSSIIF